jgi:DNA primase
LSRYATELAFCFDTDSAGQMAMKRAVTMALKNDVNVKIIAVPAPYKDPDEAIKSDPKNWLRAVENAKPSLEYWINLLVKENPDLSVLVKKQIAKEILPVIKLTFNPIEKESYIKYLAKKLAISEQSLLDTLDKTKSEVEETKEESVKAKKELSLPERIIGLLWLDQKLLELVYKIISVPDFKVDKIEQFWQMVLNKKIEKEKVPAGEVTILDQLALEVAASIDQENEESARLEIIFLLKRWQDTQKGDLKSQFAEKIRLAEEAGDRDQIKKLVAEYSSLIK